MALGFYLFDRTKGATSISHSLTQEVHKRVLKSSLRYFQVGVGVCRKRGSFRPAADF